MIKEITVKRVIEHNDCSGKKHLLVTAMEEDEIDISQFRLTHAYMMPDDKLALASVSPMDKVGVVFDHSQANLMVVGEYIQNYSDVFNRDPVCRCGVRMVSDGFNVYCFNTDCALTIAARIQRLANTSFFKPQMIHFDGEQEYHDERGVDVERQMNYHRPFEHITNGIFWGYSNGSLEHILLTKMPGRISLANFLVESLFTEMVERIGPSDVLDNVAYDNIYGFYDAMELLVSRRNFRSPEQNVLMFEFMWCLGIESLKEETIHAMIRYEESVNNVPDDPLLTYIHLLTNPSELSKETGIHPLEAKAVVGEVYRRRFEFLDIFSHYTQNNPDVLEMFGRLR